MLNNYLKIMYNFKIIHNGMVFADAVKEFCMLINYLVKAYTYGTLLRVKTLNKFEGTRLN